MVGFLLMFWSWIRCSVWSVVLSESFERLNVDHDYIRVYACHWSPACADCVCCSLATNPNEILVNCHKLLRHERWELYTITSVIIRACMCVHPGRQRGSSCGRARTTLWLRPGQSVLRPCRSLNENLFHATTPEVRDGPHRDYTEMRLHAWSLQPPVCV